MNVLKRIKEDYFKRSRLDAYRRMLVCAKDCGYRMMGIIDYYNYLRDNADGQSEKILVNRHDIDTSPKVASLMFDIEKDVYGRDGSSTYYFRQCTIDKRLIQELEAYGYETGYHYEEIADFEKKHKIRSVEGIENRIAEISPIFRQNLIDFRKNTGSQSLSVASHGDFINVLYNYGNLNLLRDTKVRNELGIIVEAYDDVVNENVEVRFADQKLLDDFSAQVEQAFNQGKECIMILTHPRNWKVDWIANTRENAKRILEGILYKIS